MKDLLQKEMKTIKFEVMGKIGTYANTVLTFCYCFIIEANGCNNTNEYIFKVINVDTTITT